jgi:signal transduction histidine kinase
MRIDKAFRSSLFLTIFVVVLFVLVSFVISILFAKYKVLSFPRPNLFIAKVIHNMQPIHPELAMPGFQLAIDRNLPLDVIIYDSFGNVLFPPGKPAIENWKQISLPQADFEEVPIHNQGIATWIHELNIASTIIKLPGSPIRYVSVVANNQGAAPPVILFTVFSILLSSVFLGVGFSLYYIFRVIRINLGRVDLVMSQLKSGNLKARIEINKMDEVGFAMSRFNLMADEIEQLVEKLRKTEKSRADLLQELAHDLRTPVASLKSLLSSLQSSEGKLPHQTVIEIFDLCLAEVSYFQRLIEDLLFLAQVSDPTYKVQPEPLDLLHIIESVTDDYRISHKNLKFLINQEVVGKKPEINFADGHLLRRYFKNAIGNAASFAKHEVRINVVFSSSEIIISVCDDGCGFSQEAMKSFGERRITRVIDKQNKSRVSIGLGSVIMKTIAQLHRGSLNPTNRLDSKGSILGGQVKFVMPIQN